MKIRFGLVMNAWIAEVQGGHHDIRAPEAQNRPHHLFRSRDRNRPREAIFAIRTYLVAKSVKVETNSRDDG
jgi:hypothetical protein